MRNIEVKRATTRKWRKNNREHLRKYNLDNPDLVFACHIKSKYGLSWERYQELLKEQQEVCAICHQKETQRKKKRLSIDHVKHTKRVRGLLCSDCNSMLGLAKHSVLILESAIEYLKRNEQ